MACRDVEIAGDVCASLGGFPALNDASGAKKERQPHLVVASHIPPT
jgi:hypothetical protein